MDLERQYASNNKYFLTNLKKKNDEMFQNEIISWTKLKVGKL